MVGGFWRVMVFSDGLRDSGVCVRGWIKGSVKGWWCWLHSCNIFELVFSSLHSAYLFIPHIILHQLVVFVSFHCNVYCSEDV